MQRGILRLARGFRHHHRDRVSRVADLPVRQRRVRRLLHGVAILEIHLPPGRHADYTVLVDVLPGKHTHHPLGRPRGRGVNSADFRVRVRAPNDSCKTHSRQHDVVRVPAATRDESLVLYPFD